MTRVGSFLELAPSAGLWRKLGCGWNRVAGYSGGLHYEKMVEDALRGVVRQALEITAKEGLPGVHHFYITFRTRYPGVEISPHLIGRHPEEMTIVLQNQFWGLDVTPEFFEVTLSFNKVNERLHVPFAAVSSFADPASKFGLQFNVDPAIERPAAAFDDAEFDPELEDESAPPITISTARLRKSASEESEGPKVGKAEAPGSKGGNSGGKVVALDAFRKK